MPDEKKDHDLDADILQSKADILKALRAAGKPASNEPDASPEQPSELLSEEDSLDEVDIFDLPDDESEHAELEPPTPDELISDFPEEELIEEEPIRIVPFEESQQYNGSTDRLSADSVDFPESPEILDENDEVINGLEHEDSLPENQASSEMKPDAPDFDIEQLRRNNRQLNDRASTLL